MNENYDMLSYQSLIDTTKDIDCTHDGSNKHFLSIIMYCAYEVHLTRKEESDLKSTCFVLIVLGNTRSRVWQTGLPSFIVLTRFFAIYYTSL